LHKLKTPKRFVCELSSTPKSSLAS